MFGNPIIIQPTKNKYPDERYKLSEKYRFIKEDKSSFEVFTELKFTSNKIYSQFKCENINCNNMYLPDLACKHCTKKFCNSCLKSCEKCSMQICLFCAKFIYIEQRDIILCYYC